MSDFIKFIIITILLGAMITVGFTLVFGVYHWFPNSFREYQSDYDETLNTPQNEALAWVMHIAGFILIVGCGICLIYVLGKTLWFIICWVFSLIPRLIIGIVSEGVFDLNYGIDIDDWF